MAKRNYLIDIDLNKNQLLNAKMQSLPTAPTGLGSNDVGYFYWNITSKDFYIWDGTAFVDSTYQHPNHSGDVVSVSDGLTTIQPNVVSNSKLAQVPTETLKGRVTAGTGNVEDLTVTQVQTLLNIEDGAQVNVETNLTISSNDANTLVILPTTGDVPSLSGTTVTLGGATQLLAGLMTATDKIKFDGIETNADVTDSVNVDAAGAVMESDYDLGYSVLVANTATVPDALQLTPNTVLGRITGNVSAIVIDNDLVTTSSGDDTLASAKAIRDYVNAVASATGHTHYRLHQPDGTNPFVYTDNSGVLHIDGDIVQSGSTYETHAEQLYTTQDLIYLRDGATTGLGVGEYAGIVATLYDGVLNGRLIFDNTGTAYVGDQGNEQPIATRVSTPITDGYFAYWESANNRLNFKQFTINDISNLNTWTGSTSITTLGTITTGVWNGGIISPTYGGTGVNNGTRSLTINTNSGTLDFTQTSSTLTIADNASISGTNTGDQTITLSGDISTSSMTNGTYTATLPNITTAGTYNKVLVNAKGQVTSGTTEAYPVKVWFTIEGDAAEASFPINHNLGTEDIVTFVRNLSTGEKVEVEEIITDQNTLTINFNIPPAIGVSYRVVIVG